MKRIIFINIFLKGSLSSSFNKSIALSNEFFREILESETLYFVFFNI